MNKDDDMHFTYPIDIYKRDLLMSIDIPSDILNNLPTGGDTEDEPLGKLYGLIPENVKKNFDNLSVSNIVLGPETYRKFSEASLQWVKYTSAERYYGYLTEEEHAELEEEDFIGGNIRRPAQRELDESFDPLHCKGDKNTWAMYMLDRSPCMANEAEENMLHITVIK